MPDGELVKTVQASGGTVDVAASPTVPAPVQWESDGFWRSELIFRTLTDRKIDAVIAMSHDVAISASIALTGSVDPHRPALFGCYSEISTEEYEVGRRRAQFVYGLVEVDRVIALSNRYGAIAEAWGVPTSKVVINPIGVDLSRFRNDLRRSTTDNRFVVACPSRFAPRKGQLDLLRAWRTLLRDLPTLELILCGDVNESDPTYLGELRAAADLPNVSIRSDVTTEILPSFLADVDAVIQPSHYEGLGFSALEAFAAGVPTILTDVPGFDEFAKDELNCLLIPPKSPQSIVTAIRRLTEDAALRNRLRAGASATVKEKFDLDKNCQSLLGSIETAIESRRAVD